MYKLCVFDMDGTVVDSVADIAGAMNRSLASLGYKTYKTEEYCHLAGDGMEMLCRRAISDKSEAEVQELISVYKEDYLANCCVNSAPYEGIPELLRELRQNGMITAVLSNKPHEQVMGVAGKLFAPDAFDEIMGYTPKFPTKPAPDSLYYIMEKYDADKSETVFIGDSNVDVFLGKNAGVYTVGVSWGFRGRAELEEAGADYVVDTVEELKNFLKK